MTAIAIKRLADDQAALPTLQTWFESEWPSYYGPTGPGNAAADLRRSMNRTTLPIALTAYVDGELCGTASLKTESVATHQHLSPWIGALVVARRHRRKGVGARLVAEVERLAAELGFQRVYGATSIQTSIFLRQGWHRYPGGPQTDARVVVYVKPIAVLGKP